MLHNIQKEESNLIFSLITLDNVQIFSLAKYVNSERYSVTSAERFTGGFR